jgi:hypothetical protein
MKDSYIRHFTKQNLKSLFSYTSIVGYFILEDSDLLLASGIRDWRKLLYSSIVLPGGISFISITVYTDFCSTTINGVFYSMFIVRRFFNPSLIKKGTSKSNRSKKSK